MKNKYENIIINLIENERFEDIKKFCEQKEFNDSYKNLIDFIIEDYGMYVVEMIEAVNIKMVSSMDINLKICSLDHIKKMILDSNNISEYALKLHRHYSKEEIKLFLKDIVNDMPASNIFFILKKYCLEYEYIFEERIKNFKKNDFFVFFKENFYSHSFNLHCLKELIYVKEKNESVFYEALNEIKFKNKSLIDNNFKNITLGRKESLYSINNSIKYSYKDPEIALLKLDYKKCKPFLNSYFDSILEDSNEICYIKEIYEDIIKDRDFIENNPVIHCISSYTNIGNKNKKIINSITKEEKLELEKKGFIVVCLMHETKNKKILSEYFFQRLLLNENNEDYLSFLIKDNVSFEFLIELNEYYELSKFKEKNINIKELINNNNDLIKLLILENGLISSNWKEIIINKYTEILKTDFK